MIDLREITITTLRHRGRIRPTDKIVKVIVDAAEKTYAERGIRTTEDRVIALSDAIRDAEEGRLPDPYRWRSIEDDE